MKLIKQYQKKNPRYNVRMQAKCKGIIIHEIACNQSNPLCFVNGWNRGGISKAVHAFAGADAVYEALRCDPSYVTWGWHAGGSANRNYISIEMCEYKGVQWPVPYACKVPDSEQKNFDNYTIAVYENTVAWAAYKCKQFGWNPLKDGVILSHVEAHNRGIASGHSDPDSVWKHVKSRKLTMNGFRQDVYKEMKGISVNNNKKNLATTSPIAGESDHDRFIRTLKGWMNKDLGYEFANDAKYTSEFENAVKSHNLKENSRYTGMVKHLQFWLNRKGYTDATGHKLDVDGDFGGKTKAAVIKLQKALGCTQDGEFGTGTMNKWLRIL